MAMYVFAPAGPDQLQNNLMRIAIEYIGLQQPGIGSPWAKGKCYIKKAIPCSGRAIKRTSIVSDKYFNHDYNQYGTGVYYYHKEFCAQIVEIVLKYIVEKKDDNALPQKFYNSNFSKLLAITYGHRISQIEWVKNTNYKEQGEAAEDVFNRLNNLH